MKLRTTCENNIWAGTIYYGINANGEYAACSTDIEIDVDEDSIEIRRGILGPCYSVKCPHCGTTLEWPQEWEIVGE